MGGGRMLQTYQTNRPDGVFLRAHCKSNTAGFSRQNCVTEYGCDDRNATATTTLRPYNNKKIMQA